MVDFWVTTIEYLKGKTTAMKRSMLSSVRVRMEFVTTILPMYELTKQAVSPWGQQAFGKEADG